MSLCPGRGVCKACGSQASGFAARNGACSLHSHHPGCSTSEHCSCLLITLIIENYRFSVGNVCLHPTFPKLPISIAVMSHPPVRFRQHWPLYLQAAWATPGDRQLSPGTALARALCAAEPSGLVQQCRQCLCSILEPVPAPTAGCLGSGCCTAQEQRGHRWVSPCAQLVVDGAEQRDHESFSCQPSQGAVLPNSAFCSQLIQSWQTGISLPEKPSDTALPSDERGCLQGAQHAVLPLAYLPSVFVCGPAKFQRP